MRGAFAAFLALAAFAALAGLWWYECAGPRPEVEEVSVEEPAQPGHPYQVRAVVRNRGRNGGEVTVVFRLRDAMGRVFTERKSIDIGGGERATVTAEIGAPPASYALEAEVHYPPQ
ncbi:MAG TPA: hypothetical protein VNN10_03700 [Dehalococcoidia bacterium]|nr:hypothetical protein [Dehalococcoidia bacterium]